MPIPPLRNWLRDTVAPYWATAPRDMAEGGFFDHIDIDGNPAIEVPKTALAHARLTHSFAHLRELGANATDCDPAGQAAFDFLTTRLWDAKEGGFFMKVGRDGDPDAPGADQRKDFYDQAFALFGMAWRYRVLGDEATLPWIQRTMAYLDDRLADPEFGGYHESDEAIRDGAAYPLPRRQNPHMHLLEAMLALFEATGETRWIDRARGIVGLFDRYFFDAGTGTLREFMDRDFTETAPPRGPIREPGHHFEWVWLLLHYRRLSGDDSVLPAADRLYAFATRHGIEQDSIGPAATFDELHPDGSIVKASKLIWPQTETVKAHLARAEFLGDAQGLARAETHLTMMFDAFFPDTKGPVWINQTDREGATIWGDALSRMLYHNLMCISEAIRLLPHLG